MKTIRARTAGTLLSTGERIGGLATVFVMLFLLVFFVYHQLRNTGFFSPKFGPAEMLALYVPILFSLIAPSSRVLTGRQDPGRLFEVATSLSLGIGSLWLFLTFPFDYAHLADALPGAIRFILSWVTDDIARAVLLLQVIVGPVAALVTLLSYLSAHRREYAHQ